MGLGAAVERSWGGDSDQLRSSQAGRIRVFGALASSSLASCRSGSLLLVFWMVRGHSDLTFNNLWLGIDRLQPS